MLGNYSKLIGSIVGGGLGILAMWGVPTEWATPELQGAIVVLMSALMTYIFPANTPN